MSSLTVAADPESYLEALLLEAASCGSLKGLLAFDSKARQQSASSTGSNISLIDIAAILLSPTYYNGTYSKLCRLRPDLKDELNYSFVSIARYLLWNLRFSVYRLKAAPSDKEARSPLGNIAIRPEPTSGKLLTIRDQSEFYEYLHEIISSSDPDHIVFPGESASYVQLSGIQLKPMDAYSITIWLKLDSKLKPNTTTCIYRCAGNPQGMEVVLGERDANHVWSVLVRSRSDSRAGGEGLAREVVREEARFACKITPDKWHLLGLTHGSRETIIATRGGSVKTDSGKGYQTHHNNDSDDRDDKFFVNLYLDGVSQDKDSPGGKELRFPFTNQSPRDYNWWFGMGFRGLIGSISLYSGIIDRNLLLLQFEQGPTYHNLHQSFRSPQSTEESGFFKQGTMLAKGKFIERAMKTDLLFCITADSFRPSSSSSPSSASSASSSEIVTTPQRFPAVLHVDASEMATIDDTTEKNLSPEKMGRCEIARDFHIQQRLSGLGGSICWMYMLWLYCDLLKEEQNGDSSSSSNNNINSNFGSNSPGSPTSSGSNSSTYGGSNNSSSGSGRIRSNSDDANGQSDVVGRIQDCLSTIYFLLKSSGEAREEFIQIHGFHVIGYCLLGLKSKDKVINESIAQSCVDIVDCFGIDSRNHDAIACALQGLLVNFKLWGQCKPPVFKVILDAIFSIGEKDKVRILHTALGYQHVIDSIRLYVLKSNESVILPSVVVSSSSPLPLPPPLVLPATATAASTSSPSPVIQLSASQSNYTAISKVIKLTLDQSKSSCIAQNAIIQSNGPNPDPKAEDKRRKIISYISSMVDYLLSCVEEDGNPLLTEDVMSYLCNAILVDHPSILLHKLVARRFCETTMCLLVSKPHTTAITRKYATQLLVRSINREYGQHIFALHNSSEYLKSENRSANSTSSTSAQTKKYYEASSQLNETSTQLLKAWKLMSNVSSLIQKTGCSTDGYIEGLNVFGIHHDIIDHDIEDNIESHVERSNIWFILPFLDTALCNASPEVYRKCIVDTNISLKTESISVEIILSYPAHMCINVFLNLAVDKLRGGLANPSLDTILDSLVYIIDCKVKTQPEDTWFILLQLEHFITKKCTGSKEEAHILFSKVMTLFLQSVLKLSSNNRLTLTLMQNLNYFLVLANNRGYCGNLVHIKNDERQKIDLLDLQSVDDDLLLFNSTIESESMMAEHILSILSHFRSMKRENNETVVVFEFEVITLAWLTILSRLNDLSETAIDHVFKEISASINDFCSLTNKNNNYEEHVYDFFRILFTLLKLSLAKAPSNDRRDRYHALVYSLCHRIFDLKKYFERNEHNIANYIVGDNPTMSQMPSVYEFIGSKFYMDINRVYIRLGDISKLQEHHFEHTPISAGSHTGGGGSSSSSMSSHSSSPDDLVNFGISDAQSYSSLPAPVGDFILDEWWRKNRNSVQDKIEKERTRLTRFINTNQLAARALSKYFKKRCHKLELEVFEDTFDCHWKLAVSNEGQLPGRRRIALRPHAKYGSSKKTHRKENIDQNELGKVLATKVVLLDTSKEVNQDSDGPSPEGDSVDLVDTKGMPSKPPFLGETWGIVDNDGSEEGFAVIGHSTAEQGEHSSGSSNSGSSSGGIAVGGGSGINSSGVDDASSSLMIPNSHDSMLGDILRSKLALKEGRYNDCGPCTPGSMKCANLKESMSSRAIMVTASGNVWGTLEFNDVEIYFVSSLDADDGHLEDHASVAVSKHRYMRRRKWQIIHISHVYLRRYRLRDTALEIFFRKGKHKSLFVDFGHTKEDESTRMNFAKALMSRTRNAITQNLNNTSSYTQLITKHAPDFNIQEQWLNGHLSNFDYLMAVNTIAGRSFNDLCQYPVMPWVIQQYTQPTIDLSDPATYRDLTKPMGALNPQRLKDFISRFSNFNDNVSNEIPAFMYGSHYSTMVGVVLYYLVRLQPFAALHKEMQSGNFDVPDRLFASIPRTFLHNTTQLSEVKELTPEWFTCADMFRNVNNFDFGETQDGSNVSEVELPPWARTPEEFIRINREALESDYVSENLHHWIDLIFGYKQTGQDAIQANNVFYYLTYYGKIDRSSLDENLRMATELQIAHFGQMPIQIFKKPHPPRKPKMYWKYPRQIWNFNNAFASRLDAANVRLLAASDEERICLDAMPMVLRCGTQVARVPFAAMSTNYRIMVFQQNGAVESFKFGLSEFSKQLLISLKTRKPTKKVAGTPSKSISTTSDKVPSQNLLDLAEDPDNAIISFDDDFNGGGGGGGSSSSSKQRDSFGDSKTPSSSDNVWDGLNQSVFPCSEPLLALERDSNSQNPDLQPNRIPICLGFSDDGDSMLNRVFTSCFSNSVMVSGGFASGRVTVREIDPFSGFIESAGDFFGHSCRVVTLASDKLPNTTTEMILSVDESGILMLWTITRHLVNKNFGVKAVYGISRRPMKRFTLWPSAQIDCDLCCNLNIGVVLIETRVVIFSLERDEKNTEFELESGDLLLPGEDKLYGAKVAICDDGFISINLRSHTTRSKGEIRVYTPTGRLCAKLENIMVSFFSCPSQSNILVCGLQDGSITVYNFFDLKVLLSFNPSRECVNIVASNPSRGGSGKYDSRDPYAQDQQSRLQHYQQQQQKQGTSVPISPIVWVSLASDASCSALLLAVNADGDLFLKALPDFVAWDKVRIPNTVTQLLNVPVQAVKSTIEKATNIAAAAVETTATVLGTAKTIADDALNDLKRRSSMTLKSFGSVLGLFGGGGSNK